MAGKRTATSDLNHDNWDDYEPEEAGTFQKAPDEILKNRVIKTARRRKPIGEESSTKNVFSSFSGFGKPSAQAESPFAFLASMTNTQTKTNGLSTMSSTNQMTFKVPTTSTTDSIKPTENGTSTTSSTTVTSNTSITEKKQLLDSKSTDYYANLKGLNESVANWIKTHVDKNPFCILTPIFKDYEKYLSEIESKKAESTTSQTSMVTTDSSVSVFKSLPATQTTALFSQTTTKTSDTNIFGAVPILDKSVELEKSSFAQKPTLSFGKSTFGPPTGFTFGTGAPFTFTNVAKPPSENKTEEEITEVEDEPPRVEFTPVVEDNNIFSKRCKVFVKKDGTFGDRGVGQLFLKPVSGSEKVQLIVRADTNLGNLLLNFILSEAIPLQRMGKNNVMLVCMPMPDAKPPPVPVLLRVKTAEEADELLKILEKNKK